ncbi:LON peptidase substrate-binding domain-containing protein [Comamonas sp.]|uniref:LON peptidase substrate-binding domain-containing protein n=1 Tax=Comamonas sp. TaxID=34028 RepID=UPI003A8D9BE8
MTDSITLHSLPLFPLGTVLFPGGLLSLRVFEVRYLDMIRKCQAAKAPFGVVALQAGQEVRKPGAQPEQLHPEGVLAQLVQLDSSQPGLMQLQCRGEQRFHIASSWQLSHGLWVADVQLLADDPQVAIPDHLRSVARALAQVLQQLRARAQDPDHSQQPTPQQLDDCAWVANRWAELLPLPILVKQQLMTLDNPLLRLELVADVLEKSGIGASDED